MRNFKINKKGEMEFERRKTRVAYTKKCKGVEFRIRETGMNWTIDVKEKGSKVWKRVQSMADLKYAIDVVNNQKECLAWN
jgi:hypothetical protein